MDEKKNHTHSFLEPTGIRLAVDFFNPLHFFNPLPALQGHDTLRNQLTEFAYLINLDSAINRLYEAA